MSHLSSHSWTRLALAAVLLAALALVVAPSAFAAGTITVNNTVACVTGSGQSNPYLVTYCTVEDAVVDSVAGDTISVAGGTYTPVGAVALNKSGLTMDGAGAGATVVQVSGAVGISVQAADVTVQDLEILKTDKAGTIIDIANGNNLTIKNNTIHGQFVIGDPEVSRAMVVYAGGFAGLNIEGNTIYALRQPAYVSGTHTGTVQNNLTYGTKGWVLEGGNLTFTGNTWGTGAQANVYDIAIIPTMPGTYYTDIVAMSNANNGAVIEDQRTSPRVVSVVYVDDNSTCLSDCGGAVYPEPTITKGVARVVAGGTIKVLPGAYNESPALNKSLTLQSTGGRDVTTINLQTGPSYLGAMHITGAEVTVDGFTVNGFDAVNPSLASTNITLAYPAGNVTLKNNRVKVGQADAGTNGDDGFGIATYYNTTNDIASLTVTGNIFEPLNAAGTRAFYINPGVNNFIFTGNQITGNFTKSAATQAKNGLVEGNTITGVGAAGSRSAGMSTWGYPNPTVYGKTTFRNNSFTGVGTGVAIRSTEGVVVEQNTFTDVDRAVSVEEYYGAFDPSTIEIHKNKFVNAGTGVQNSTTGGVDAEQNYWGSITGPGPVGPGTGAPVSTNVDFEPWCNEDFSNCTYPATIAMQVLSSPAEVGEVVTMDTLVTAVDVYGMQLNVQFDPTQLAFQAPPASSHNDVSAAGWYWDFLGENFAPVITATTNGVRLSGSLMNPPHANPATLTGQSVATWKFKCLQAGTWNLTYAATPGTGTFLSTKDGFAIPATLGTATVECRATTASVDGYITLQGRLATNPVPAAFQGTKVTLTCASAECVGFGPYEMTTDASGHYQHLKTATPGSGVVLGTYSATVVRRAYLSATKTANVVIVSGLNTINTLATAPRLLGGDVDGTVGISIGDLSAIGGVFGSTVTPADTGSDVNGDGFVNIFDLSIAGGNYGKTSSIW